MTGKEWIERHGLKEGEYVGVYPGTLGVTRELLEELGEVEFTESDLEILKFTPDSRVDVREVISDEFIETIAQVGDVDVKKIREEMEKGIENEPVEEI